MSEQAETATVAATAEAGVVVGAGAPRFLRWYLGCIVGFLVVLCSFVVWCNPWGNYGPIGMQDLYNARITKLDHIAALPVAERPELLVLGSSNVMRYDPVTITRETGLTAFNHGVFWGKAEDFLCIMRHYVHDLNYRPKVLFVGLDTWTLRAAGHEHPFFPGVRRRHLNADRIVKYNPDVNPALLWLSRALDTLYAQQIRIAWGMFRNGSKRTRLPVLGSPESKFTATGMRLNYGRIYGADRSSVFEATEAGQYDVGADIAPIIARGDLHAVYHYSTYNFSAFSAARVGYIDALLSLADKEGIQVVFVMNPVHPVFWKMLTTATPHLANLKRLHDLIDGWKRTHPSLVGMYDASQIARFGGDPTGFYDEIHVATRNCDRIIPHLARLVKKP